MIFYAMLFASFQKIRRCNVNTGLILLQDILLARQCSVKGKKMSITGNGTLSKTIGYNPVFTYRTCPEGAYFPNLD